MPDDWRPTVGQVALIGPPGSDSDEERVTGVVVSDGERLLLDLGASPPSVAGGSSDVVVSFYRPEALYRVKARATHPDEGRRVVELDVAGVERVQRRANRRVPLRLPVSLSAFDGAGDFSSVLGETVNVSPGGCRVSTGRSFPPGVDPTVSIRVPDGAPVVALARVLETRCAPDHWEYRMVFAQIADDDARRLEALDPDPGSQSPEARGPRPGA